MGRRNLILFEYTLITIEVGEDGFSYLETPLLRLDQRGPKGIGIALTPEALVADDRGLTVDGFDRIIIELNANFLEDFLISCVETSLFLHVTYLMAAWAVEGLSVVEQENSFGEIITFFLFTVPDGSIHLLYLLCFRP